MRNSTNNEYKYATNQDGHLIDVRNASRTDGYTCPSCGAEMIPHMGKIRKWHFTHKSVCACNPETYLHKIAKARIKAAFLKSDKFDITFNAVHICAAKCPFHNVTKCQTKRYTTFNLRQFYDICEEEVYWNGLKPDLLLLSSTYPSREPIFIEIHVSHKSTEDKITSGHRIIEITVQSEGDIDSIISKCEIKGEIIEQHDFSTTAERDVKCRFYNFNRNYHMNPSVELYDYMHIFAVKDNGYFTYDRISCFESLSEIFPDDEFNFIISNAPINWKQAFDEFDKHGLQITNCIRCTFYKHSFIGEPICTLYKRYGTPKSPPIKEARTCKYYKKSISNANRDGYYDNPFLFKKTSYKVIIRKNT